MNKFERKSFNNWWFWFFSKKSHEELDNNKFEIILLTRSDYKKALIEKSNKKLKVFLINWDDQNDVNAKLKDANYIIHTAAKVPTHRSSNNFNIIKSSLKIAKTIDKANLNLKNLFLYLH